jgi:hypothetical protein
MSRQNGKWEAEIKIQPPDQDAPYYAAIEDADPARVHAFLRTAADGCRLMPGLETRQEPRLHTSDLGYRPAVTAEEADRLRAQLADNAATLEAGAREIVRLTRELGEARAEVGVVHKLREEEHEAWSRLRVSFEDECGEKQARIAALADEERRKLSGDAMQAELLLSAANRKAEHEFNRASALERACAEKDRRTAAHEEILRFALAETVVSKQQIEVTKALRALLDAGVDDDIRLVETLGDADEHLARRSEAFVRAFKEARRVLGED